MNGEIAQRRSERLAVAGQAAGMLADFAFRNGILLVYFKALGFAGDRVLFFLSVPPVLMLLVRLPTAHVADRIGLKRVAVAGFWVVPFAFLCFIAAGFFEGLTKSVFVLVGVSASGIGMAVGPCGLMPLLKRIVPPETRGRFFGRFHTTWQAVGLAFVALCALTLPETVPVSLYQWILGVIVVGGALRAVLISGMTEPPKSDGSSLGFWRSFERAWKAPGFAAFSSYVFLMATATGAAQFIFGLLEKEVLGFGDNLVVWMGNLTMVGSLFGFVFAGRITDRLGSKPVFVLCHLGYAVSMSLFLTRGVVSPSALAATVHLLYGFCWAASMVAITTELYGLVLPENEAMGTSVPLLLFHFGGAAAGVLASLALNRGLLAAEWTLFGMTLSRFDTLLLMEATAVVFLIVALGMVPSVLASGREREAS